MYWMTSGRYLYGSALFLFANVVYGASLAIYNAFLPEIASAEERDQTSSAGWGFGYLGGGLLLALQLALFSNASKLGLTEGDAARIALASSGLWWGAFTLVPYFTLRNRGASRQPPVGQSQLGAALRQLAATIKEVRGLPQTMLFLCAYLIYNDAAQTMITMAAQFGSEELHLSLATLSSAILLTQFVAVAGSLTFDRLSRRIGAKQAVMVSLVVWIGVLVYIFAALSTTAEFYALAATVGFVMGGTQALSRSLFSFLIPKGHEAEYFSVYEISDKGTSWLGPLTVGLALQWTGNFRVALLTLMVFFAAGLLLLSRVDMKRAAGEAGNEFA
jgi:UMF1 family MFS transporter